MNELARKLPPEMDGGEPPRRPPERIKLHLVNEEDLSSTPRRLASFEDYRQAIVDTQNRIHEIYENIKGAEKEFADKLREELAELEDELAKYKEQFDKKLPLYVDNLRKRSEKKQKDLKTLERWETVGKHDIESQKRFEQVERIKGEIKEIDAEIARYTKPAVEITTVNESIKAPELKPEDFSLFKGAPEEEVKITIKYFASLDTKGKIELANQLFGRITKEGSGVLTKDETIILTDPKVGMLGFYELKQQQAKNETALSYNHWQKTLEDNKPKGFWGKVVGLFKTNPEVTAAEQIYKQTQQMYEAIYEEYLRYVGRLQEFGLVGGASGNISPEAAADIAAKANSITERSSNIERPYNPQG